MRLAGRLPAIWLVVGLLCACAGENLDVDVDARYQEVRSRLLGAHLVNGVVVSLGQGESQPNNRDALLHTSLTLAALPCADAPRLLTGIAALEIEPGRYVRYFDFPASDQVSRDMIIGLVFGLTQKYRTCPALRAEIRGRVRRLLAYVDRTGGSLGVGPAAQLTPASRAALQFAAQIMQLRAGPTATDRSVVAAQAAVLPLTVMGSGYEFYAVHLTALELLLWTWAAPAAFDLRLAQSAFCRGTAAYRNPLYDGLCGRTSNVGDALKGWTYNCIVYRWQVANPWNDCAPAGIEHPGHDFLLLYQLTLRDGLIGGFVNEVERKLPEEALLKPVAAVPSLLPALPGLEWAW